jgi:hypothetical protein
MCCAIRRGGGAGAVAAEAGIGVLVARNGFKMPPPGASFKSAVAIPIA